jgi:hypothetical protein
MPPRYADYEADSVVEDASGDMAPRVATRVYDQILRSPAPAIYERWPILGGHLLGAPVDVIADGLARGERWTVGPAPMAAGRSASKTAIWLRGMDVSYRDQIAAWRPKPIEPT